MGIDSAMEKSSAWLQFGFISLILSINCTGRAKFAGLQIAESGGRTGQRYAKRKRNMAG